MITPKRKLSSEEQDAAIVLYDTYLFAKLFWADELTIPEERHDLGDKVGRQIVSREQRIMFLAGCEYMLLRDVLPDAINWSPSRVALRTSRKVGKTIGLEARWIQIALAYKTSKNGIMEGLAHTPADVHMRPILDRVMSRIRSVPIFSAMHIAVSGTTEMQSWANGWRWLIRVEGMTKSAEQAGRSQVGSRAYAMIGDEADFSSDAAWSQREQSAMPSAYIYEGGVPRGWHGPFWRICNVKNTQGAKWFVFHTDMRANPLVHSYRAWEEQVQGNYRSPRTQTQVLGMDGAEMVTSFPVLPVDMAHPYVTRTFTVDDLDRYRDNLSELFQLPHSRTDAYIIAMDYGMSPSATEIFVLGRERTFWRVLARWELMKCDVYPTAGVIHHIDTVTLPKTADIIMIDAHGAGGGVVSVLQRNPAWANLNYHQRVRNANFAGHTKDPSQLLHTRCREPVITRQNGHEWYCIHCRAVITTVTEIVERSVQTKMWLLGRLKEALSHGKRILDNRSGGWTVDGLVLGWDEALIDELSSATETATMNAVRINTASGKDHIIDGLLAAVAGMEAWKKGLYTNTAHVTEYGWVKISGGERADWRPPWDLR